VLLEKHASRAGVVVSYLPCWDWAVEVMLVLVAECLQLRLLYHFFQLLALALVVWVVVLCPASLLYRMRR
jgi:hypothetical protein